MARRSRFGQSSGGFPKWGWIIIGAILLTGAILGILAAAGVNWWGGKKNKGSAPVSNGGSFPPYSGGVNPRISTPMISVRPAPIVSIKPGTCKDDIDANNISNLNQGLVEANICTSASQCCSNYCQLDPVKAGYLMGIDPDRYAPDPITGATTLATLKFCGVPTEATGPDGCAYGLNIGGAAIANLISGGG